MALPFRPFLAGVHSPSLETDCTLEWPQRVRHLDIFGLLWIDYTHIYPQVEGAWVVVGRRGALLLTGSLANICTAAIRKRWQRQRQRTAIDRQIARQFTIPLWHPTLFAYLLTFNGLLSSHTHRYTHAHTQRKLAEIFGAARCANRQTAARFLLQTHYLASVYVCVCKCACVPVCVCV